MSEPNAAALGALTGLAVVKWNLSHSGLAFDATFVNVNGQDANLFIFLCSAFATGYSYLSQPMSTAKLREYYVHVVLEYVFLYYVGLCVFFYLTGDPTIFWCLAGFHTHELFQLWTESVKFQYFVYIFPALWYIYQSERARPWHLPLAVVVGLLYAAAALKLVPSVAAAFPWLPSIFTFEQSRCTDNPIGCMPAYLPSMLIGTLLGHHWPRIASLCTLHAAVIRTLAPLLCVYWCLNSNAYRWNLGLHSIWRFYEGTARPALADYRGLVYALPWLYEWTYLDPVNFGCTTALVVAAASSPSTLACLSAPPLQWLGDIARAWYVFFLPINLVLTFGKFAPRAAPPPMVAAQSKAVRTLISTVLSLVVASLFRRLLATFAKARPFPAFLRQSHQAQGSAAIASKAVIL